MKEDSQTPRIDPRLEARIVALVLGEASDFEGDELNRLIDQRPELASLKLQIQHVHGLLRDVATGESVAKDDDWKLSAEKRSRVLAVIGGESEEQPAKQGVNRSIENRRSVNGNLFWSFTKIAAAFCAVGFFGSLVIVAFQFTRATSSARMGALAYVESRTAESENASELSFDVAAQPSEHLFFEDARITAADDERFETAQQPYAGAELDHNSKSSSALSAIRDSLSNVDATPPSPYYRMDGAQDFSEARESGMLRYSTESPKAGPSGTRSRTLDEAAIAADPTQWQAADAYALGVPEFGSGESAPLPAAVLPNYSLDVKSGFGAYGELGREVEAEDAANRLSAALGLADRPVVAGKSESSPATPAFDFQVPGQGQALSDKQLRQPAGENLGFSIDLGDSPASGEAKGVAGGTSLGGGGFAGGGAAPNGEEMLEREHVQRDHGVWLDHAHARGTAPAKPRLSDIAGIAGRKDAEKGSRYDAFGVDGLADSVRSPTDELASSSAFFKSNGGFSVPDRYEEDFVTEGAGVATDDDIAIHNGRPFDDSALDDRPMLGPVTGSDSGQSGGESSAELAKQDGGWRYGRNSSRESLRSAHQSGAMPNAGFSLEESGKMDATRRGDVAHDIETRVQDSLGEISALNEFDGITKSLPDVPPGDHAEAAANHWELPQLNAKEDPSALSRLAVDGENRWRRNVPLTLRDDSKSLRLRWKKHAAPSGLEENSAENEAFSTFSLHVSDVSFKLAQAALARGEWPDAEKVRIEEFVNAFDYGDPMPSQSDKVACRVEQSIHPFLQQRNLLRVSMRTGAAGRASNTPLRLTLLLDNSGSMERIDRQQTVRRAFALLAQQLKPIDQVTLISFARGPRLLADKVSGSDSRQLVDLVRDLPSEGGTNIESALQLAFEKAREQQVDNAQNRIILLTDGAVNLGDANPESLSRMITMMRGVGIAFDAAGISAEGLNDEVLEALTRQGDGRYYLLDSLEAADDGFARQIAGALRPSAKNVKVQIEFNRKRVGRYKLLGFEKHRLKQEDFRDDKVDAAEMAAAEAGVAMYQFEAKPDGEGDVGLVSVRFRDLSTGQMIENHWPIPYEPDAPRPAHAAPSLRIASSAALLAAKLRGEPLGEFVDLKSLSELIEGLPDQYRNADRVGQLQQMIQQARQLIGK